MVFTLIIWYLSQLSTVKCFPFVIKKLFVRSYLKCSEFSSLPETFSLFVYVYQCGRHGSRSIQWASICCCWWRNSHIWPVRTSSGQLLCLWHVPIILGALSYFLTQWDVPGSFSTFAVPALESVFSLRSSGSFQWRTIFGRQPNVSCVHCYWDVTVPRTSQWKS